MKFHLLLMLPFVWIPSVVVSESAPSEAQLALLGEEYNTMRQMRYRLKELLEQQEFADKLNQADDIFADFQQLEQWLAQLDENPESFSEVMEMLEEFEQRLAELLEQQQAMAEFLPTPPEQSSQPTEEMELSSLMEQVRQLLQENKRAEAQELLNQMLSAFQQQQEQLQQSTSQYYDEKYSEMMEQFNQLQQQLAEALRQELSLIHI